MAQLGIHRKLGRTSARPWDSSFLRSFAGLFWLASSSLLGCTLDTAGTYSSNTQGTGGDGQGGQGSGGSASGGGSTQGNECKTATDCPASASNCAVVECSNGYCSKTPAAAGVVCRERAADCDVEEACDGVAFDCPADAFAAVGTLCRAPATACDVIEACDGVNATCAPDTGPAAACQPGLPITYFALDRTFTISSVDLNNTGSATATVSPGASVSLKVGGSWTRKAMPDCGGCITQFYVVMTGVLTDCMDVTSTSGAINRNIIFTAPQAKGAYIIKPAATWEFSCKTSLDVGNAFDSTALATLIVE